MTNIYVPVASLDAYKASYPRLKDVTIPKHFQEVKDVNKFIISGFANNRIKRHENQATIRVFLLESFEPFWLK